MPKRFHYRPGRSSQINSTTVFALIFHGLLIFGVSIAYSPAISENKQLEVALSVASSEDAPDEADFIAETNQIGSGTLEKAREMTQRPQKESAVLVVIPLLGAPAFFATVEH